MRTKSLCALGASFALFALASADCECGYTVKGSKESGVDSHFFLNAFESDFIHLDQVDASVGWRPQQYLVSPEEARGSYGKKAEPSQVVPNYIKDDDKWTGEGVVGPDPGLRLIAAAEPQDGALLMGEISSVRNDFLYGSFRMGAKLTRTKGTCSAFFYYRNNSNEIDMEFLSERYNDTANMAHLINQTPESLEHGFDAKGTPGYRQYELPFKPYEGYHEYRFDWTPDLIAYYLDGEEVWSLDEQVPADSGHLILNHWSNGDPLWSGGPPEQDAIMTISYVKVYFNSSAPADASDFEKRCKKRDEAKVCAVPDQVTPADPNMSQGGQTVFLTGAGSAVWPSQLGFVFVAAVVLAQAVATL